MKGIEQNKYYIWLSSIDKLSTREKVKLLNKYKDPQILFNKTKKELEEELLGYFENSKKIIKEITNLYYKIRLEINIKNIKRYKLKIVSYNDEEYPKQLKYVSDHPICLYCRGNIELLNRAKKIAIIGCRDYSKYGEKIAKEFAYKLAQENIVIVSGGARGIDSFAHQGTINANKETIAVLGNGIDYIYPPENKKLEEQILENNGLITSEYIIGTKPSKYTFPARNRIISGISDGVLVIEAKEKSGTLITVDFALEQGKNVYAIPGNIDSKNAVGTNELIKQGARLITAPEEILEDLKINNY